MGIWRKLFGKKESHLSHPRPARDAKSPPTGASRAGPEQLAATVISGKPGQRRPALARLDSMMWQGGKEDVLRRLWAALPSGPLDGPGECELAGFLLRYDTTNRPRARELLLEAFRTPDRGTRDFLSKLLTGDARKWTDPECVRAVRDRAVQALGAGSSADREWAVGSLGAVPPRDLREVKGIEEMLVAALADGEQSVGDHAACILRQLGAEVTPRRLPAFVEALRQPRSEAGASSLIALIGKAGPDAVPAVDALAAIVRTGQAGPGVFEQIESAARSASGPGDTLLVSFSTALAQDAAEALAAIGDAAVPALTDLLAVPNPTARKHAVAALERIGSASAAAEPALLGLLNEKDWLVRLQAASILAQFCPAAVDRVVAAVLPGLKHAKWMVRGRAAIVLGLAGPAAAPAADALTEMLGDPEKSVAKEARQALDRITGA